jgi:sulfate adenylyltransferase subunit 1/sulfate transport system substrate-binding protein
MARAALAGLLRCALALASLAVPAAALASQTLLNVSYDPTRELFKAVNPVFAAEWRAKTGESLSLLSSHGGSGAQARAVIDGLRADVVTLALAGDIDAIAAKSGKIPADWQKLLPNNSSPYTSTIVFVVRKGNPKGIKDWDDLAKSGVGVVAANPKTGGGARWSYLAAWGYGLAKFGGDEEKTKAFVQAIYKNAPVLDTGARGATTSFARRGLGDVLISWENEAFLLLKEFGPEGFEIVAPSRSILAEPAVAVVEGNAKTHGALEPARSYLEFLYSPVAQALIAKNFYRPAHPEFAAKEDTDRFARIEFFTIDEVFGGWAAAQKKHFADGGIFDEMQRREAGR